MRLTFCSNHHNAASYVRSSSLLAAVCSRTGKTLHAIENFKSSNEAASLKEVWTTEGAYAFIFHLYPDKAVLLRVRLTLSIAANRLAFSANESSSQVVDVKSSS